MTDKSSKREMTPEQEAECREIFKRHMGALGSSGDRMFNGEEGWIAKHMYAAGLAAKSPQQGAAELRPISELGMPPQNVTVLMRRTGSPQIPKWEWGYISPTAPAEQPSVHAGYVKIEGNPATKPAALSTRHEDACRVHNGAGPCSCGYETVLRDALEEEWLHRTWAEAQLCVLQSERAKERTEFSPKEQPSDKQIGDPFDAAVELGKKLTAAERQIEQLIDERDAAEEALSQAYFLVIGESPEWSNLFGHEQALEEIDAAQQTLRKSIKEQPSALSKKE